jgi:hypothetical protein
MLSPGTHEMKLLVALEANDTILVQISENEHAIAHVNLDAATAMEVARQLTKLAEKIK